MSPRRLYLDNAATSFPKPPAVTQAMVRYATEIGASAGRGAYAEAIEAAAVIQQCRQRIRQLINAERPEQIIFTLNCTDALSLAIRGLIELQPPGHAICAEIDHNSVLRPLNAMAQRGAVQVTRLRIDSSTGLIDLDELRRSVRRDTRLIALTHASNVTGTVQPLSAVARIARECGVPLVVDAAQSAGHLPINVQADGIDLLAAPGHKGLLGPLGTGFLYVRPGLEPTLEPLRRGGTGSISEQDVQPDFMPDRYESGSHNAIGIAGLSEGVKWVLDQTVAALHERERDLMRMFIDGASNVEGLRYYGPQGIRDRVGVFSVRVDGYEPQELAAALESSYGVLTRAGIHCAPLAHQALGTTPLGGTTRLSFGPFLTVQDVKYATDALADLAMTAPRRVAVRA